ncbi:DNA-directed RNA polymerase, mitochondrial [Drosophila grimshawi]|uniref:DNA-directed RNA polymerase n=1 Tax=Drosophila grimshawi TaxID=7222 RepID=B4JQF3_DROGR|nr:DNA-directed RNA polymerase, mitochondrial [Drosophila grimshawi]EDV99133.1 GH13202 [Drosophila grimshawi]
MYRLLSANRATAVRRTLRLPTPASTNGCCCSCGGGSSVGSTAHNFTQYQQYYQMLYRQAPATTTTISALRTHSSTPTQTDAHALAKKKRLRKPRYAKYVELLEVTELTASERKSRVKRLKSKKLAEFIQKTQLQILEKRAREERRVLKKGKPGTEEAAPRQPAEYQKIDIDPLDSSILEAGLYDDKPLIFFGKEMYTKQVIANPDEVHKILKSFHNYRNIIESMENEQQDNVEADLTSFGLTTPKHIPETELLDPFEAIEPYIEVQETHKTDVPAVNVPNVNAVTAKSKKRFKSKVHVNEEQERMAKQRALIINLTTYLNVCVSANMLNRALSTIFAYRSRTKKSSVQHPKLSSNLITIDLYNILLHGYAGKGSFDRCQELFKLIHEDGLEFSEQTYAATFECLGRVESNAQNQQLIEQYIAEAEQQGYSLNQIMDRSKFVSDQRDIALDAIRRVRAEFMPVYVPPPLGYDNELLNDLNAQTLPVGATLEADVTAEDCVIMNPKRGYSKTQLEQLAREQLQVELDGYITIKSIEKTKEFANAEYCRSKLKELEQGWRKQISAAIVRDLNTLRAQVRFKPHGYMNYYTYLKVLDTTQFADILIKELYKLAEGSETFSPTVSQLYKELGQKVQQCYQIEQKKHNGILEKIGDIYSAYCELWDSGRTTDNTRQMWQRLVHDERHSGPSMDLPEVPWPTNVLAGVGRFLYNILMRDIKIDAHIMRQKSKAKTTSATMASHNLLPAFYTLFRNQGRLVKEEVKPHPVLSRLLRASRQQTLTFDSNLVPMLCPPQPWSTPHNGGYLLNKSELIRLPHQAVQQWERIRSSNPQHLYPAIDSLNQLASVPWRVNTQLLDVIIKVFRNGGNAKLDVPQPPSSLPPLPTLPSSDKDSETVSPAERAKQFRDKLGHRRKQAEMYSLWCDALYRLSLAQHYRDKVFWLPHNMDFRGRVYPVPPHLNHLGSDLARSMLIFDQAQPLGVDGFSWLKLHCINLTGMKKRDSVRERLLYAEEIMPDILDSADNPLTGRMWWAKSDEPWQTLGCCMEIAKVQRSPDPAAYLSRFPIHQDGSCNGLQHYAALGRDQAGACSVNLSPSAIPQDVYSAVATMVERTRKTDAQSGLHVAQALEGFVRRKVIKQTVMTTVYGVTRYGARLQIARQLKDIDDFPKDWVWPASTYLTTKTFESLREMFTSTREIQDWFTECARLIAGVCSQNVEWITPLGLPVVQPYNRQEAKPVLRNSGLRVNANMPMDMYERPNILKQKNAFPPNFIHSLDSSHMMLTSLHCERQGITFVSVHDCFWTHACRVPELNRACREQFVALHSQPILEKLSEFMRQTYSFRDNDFTNDGSVEDLSKRQLNRTLRQLPQKGDFDLNNVLSSVYFFS